METLQRTANRGSISTGFDIDNSVKLEADNTEFFSRTPSSNSNRQTFTYSTWIKRTELGINGAILDAYQDGANFFLLQFDTNDRFVIYQIDSGTDYGYHYTRRFRDTGAWYHIVFVSDTTNATAADRYQLYVNGERISNSDVDTDYGTPPQNYNNNLNSTIAHSIGKRGDGPTYNSCYLAETHLVDGTALAPTAFGEFDEDSGIWKPIEVSGLTYGTNGFYLDYADASDLGDDESGNGNDWTENNITAADQATDTPTNNFCIGNPIAVSPSNLVKFTNGGTVAVRQTADAWNFFTTTMPVNKGKWYAEFKVGNAVAMVGIGALSYVESTAYGSLTGMGQAANSGVGYYGADGKRFVDNTEAAYGSSFGTSDIISIAMDLDNDYVYFAKNGVWQNSGDPTSGATGTGALSTDPVGDYFVMTINGLYNPVTHYMNYGGYTAMSISSGASDDNGYGTFEYAPPSGYYALCTKNLAEYG